MGATSSRALLVIALVGALAAAGDAQAKSGKPNDQGPALQASERAHAVHADAAPVAPLPAAVEPATAPAALPARDAPPAAAPVAPPAAAVPAQAPVTFAAVQVAPPDAAWPWARALWALPALGALGAVLAARRRKGAADAPVALDDVPTALRAGHAATERGDLAGALACFDRALALAPGLGVALFCRGVCLAAMGRAAEAYGALAESVAADPADGMRRVHLARAAVACGRTREAMDALAPLTLTDAAVGDALYDDEALAGLRDHPRFLAMCGRL